MEIENTTRLLKICIITLIISLSFTFASSFELYQLIGKYNNLRLEYAALHKYERKVTDECLKIAHF